MRIKDPCSLHLRMHNRCGTIARQAHLFRTRQIRASSTNAFGSTLPEVIEKQGWDAAWQKGMTPWDTGSPHQVVTDLIASGSLPDGAVLVPGSGSGYDAFTFAKSGRKTVSVDISKTAVARCQQLVKGNEDLNKLSNLEIRCADFFAMTAKEPFGVVWDYTFMAALPVDWREKWAQTMKRVVAPDGLVLLSKQSARDVLLRPERKCRSRLGKEHSV